MSSERPTVVILHGRPAAGKLTIGKELAKVSSMKLFHNHLVVDALMALFPFGSPSFVKHRENIWMEVMRDAVRERTSFIFTFSPESTVAETFIEDLRRNLEGDGAQVVLVEIACDNSVLKDRMGSESRHKCQKLTSFEFYEQLQQQGLCKYPAISAHFTVDSGSMSPEESAQAIWQFVSKEYRSIQS